MNAYANNNIVSTYIENNVYPLKQRISDAKMSKNISELSSIWREIQDIISDIKYDARFIEVSEDLMNLRESISNTIVEYAKNNVL